MLDFLFNVIISENGVFASIVVIPRNHKRLVIRRVEETHIAHLYVCDLLRTHLEPILLLKRGLHNNRKVVSKSAAQDVELILPLRGSDHDRSVLELLALDVEMGCEIEGCHVERPYMHHIVVIDPADHRGVQTSRNSCQQETGFAKSAHGSGPSGD